MFCPCESIRFTSATVYTVYGTVIVQFYSTVFDAVNMMLEFDCTFDMYAKKFITFGPNFTFSTRLTTVVYQTNP